MTGPRVYIAFTPYHLLLALALQDRDGCPDAFVLFADEAGLLAHAPEIEAAVAGFVDLQVAPVLGPHPRREIAARYRIAASFARGFVRRVQPSEVYVFNGLRPESRSAFRACSPGTSFHYVEDGLDAYVACNRADIGRLHRTLFRASCGTPHPLSADMITALPFAGYDVLAPELFRGAGIGADAIPVRSLRRATQLLDAALSLPAPARPITDLYLLANSERMADRLQSLRTMAREVQRRVAIDPDTCVAVKAHPREQQPEVMDAVRRLGDTVVPHWVPAELLAGVLHPRVSVHCGLSTFVVSSRKLVPERSLSLDETVSPDDAYALRCWDPSIAFVGGAELKVVA